MNSTDRLREMRMRGRGGPKSPKFCGRLLSIAPNGESEEIKNDIINKGFSVDKCNLNPSTGSA